MAIKTELVDYEHNGTTLEGYMAYEESDTPQPCILICHAWGGRGEHEEETARKLAGLGYVGFVVDVYGKGVRGTTKEECIELMTPFVEDRDMLVERLSAGMETAAAQNAVKEGRIAVTGYCFGGLCALDMARANTGVLGACAFHAVVGQPGAPDDGKDITAKVMALQGWDDPMAKPDALQAFGDEMTRRKADWQLHAYGGVMHAFTNKGANDPDFGTVYDAQADRRSWSTFTSFLEELFRV